MRTIISIEYDEKYQSVAVSNHRKTLFSTGDVVADFRSAMIFASNIDNVCFSSTCDGFVFDIPGYKWNIDSVYGDMIVSI